ncbi:MAG: hypothetical protein ABI378_03980 [Chitinophagaceae bacterium]
MARINFPDNFAAQQTLLTNLHAKHTADGTSSDLLPYFAQQNLNIAADVAAGEQAAIHETARGLFSRNAENFRELRDNRFKPVFARFKGLVQFLKSLNKGNERALAEWGITVDNQSKIVYPTDFDTQAALYTTFAEKHSSFDPISAPLNPYIGKQIISMDADHTAVTNATTSNASMKAAANNSESEKVLRDNLWQPVVAHLRGSIDYLKKLNSDNPKALGAWGITADDSPRQPRVRTTSLIIGETITISGAIIGGTFTNLGASDLHLYKGKTTTGTPEIVHAGEQFGILKGWSILTVVNVSVLVAGKFSLLVSNTAI